MKGEGVVVPAVLIGSARVDLLDHVRMIQGASAWLHGRGAHAPAAFFAVVCLEEAAKCHVLDSCAGHERGMTSVDRREIDSHKKRIALLLRKMRGGDARHGKSPVPDADAVASRLNAIKQLAVYHECAGGGAVTLGGALGAPGLRRVSEILQEVVASGVASLDAVPRSGSGSAESADILLAEVMELSSAVAEPVPIGASGGIPAGDLHAVLQSLENHVAVLDKFAVDLHNGGHYEASIFMSIMSFEEASKHYFLAKCRRSGGGVEADQVDVLRDHSSKLSVFFRDVARYLGDSNVDRHSKPPGKYSIIHPEAFLKLDGLKQLALYFDHMCGRTMTLRKLLGNHTAMVSKYLRDILIGMVSWAIICDGDAENPYRRHNTNPMHYQRYQELVRFKTNPKNEAYDQAMYWIVGRLDCLNDAVRCRDERRCEAELSHILAGLQDQGGRKTHMSQK